MVTYNKTPKSIKDQIELLKQRGLIVKDPTSAENFFSCVSYYRFSAYCLPFENTRHKFNENVSFEQIKNLYEFDRLLRFQTGKALKLIEIAIRTAVINKLSLKYNDAFIHEQPSRFYDKNKHKAWLESVHEEISKSKETFTEHYKSNYNGFPRLPIWMAIEVISFGDLSRMIASLQKEDQIMIAKHFNFKNHRIFTTWVHTFTYIRNICAHHARLWNRSLAISPEIPETEPWRGVNPKHSATIIFTILDFLKKASFDSTTVEEWHSTMNKILATKIDQLSILDGMGFPSQKLEHPLWKI